MAREKIIDCIGACDKDVAHLRLLLRTCAAHLDAPWQWGHEDQADLVIVDADSLAGFAARARVLQRGVQCAELIPADAPEPKGFFLRKPLHRNAFIALLNSGSKRAVAPFAVLSQGDDFFMVDLGEFEDDSNIELPKFEEVPQRTLPSAEELDAFEALFKRDELADTPMMLTPDRLEARTSVEYTGEKTSRSSRNTQHRNPFADLADGTTENIDPSVRSFSNAQDEGAHSLRDYLGGGLLGSPCRIALPGLPALVLDPKQQAFHAEVGLSALEEYCRRPLRREDWQALLGSDLRDLRERLPAQPYSRLQWLDRMIAADGYLSAHLDPGGSYQLTRMLELAQEYPRAFRISSAMMGQPLRLHEIVETSHTSMAEVFSVVSAYDAIGWVEWQLRESFRTHAKPPR